MILDTCTIEPCADEAAGCPDCGATPAADYIAVEFPFTSPLERDNLLLMRELQQAREELTTLAWVKEFLRENFDNEAIELVHRLAEANNRIASLTWVEDMANQYCNCGYLLPGGRYSRHTNPENHEADCAYARRVQP